MFNLLRCAFLLSTILISPIASGDLLSLAKPAVSTFEGCDDMHGVSVKAIAQDREGFVWIGTTIGLFRCDAVHTQYFHYEEDNPHSLGGDFVTTIHVAADGRKLWIGTMSDGVSVFDTTTQRFTRYQHAPENPHSLSHNSIEDIEEDAHGGIWIASANGLNYVAPGANTFTHFYHDATDNQSLRHNHVKTLQFDAKNTLWIGSLDGVDTLNVDTGQITRMAIRDSGGFALAGKRVEKLFFSANGTLWIGTKNHGLVWRTPSGEVKRLNAGLLTNPWVIDIVQPAGSKLWLGTYGGGVNIIDEHSGTVEKILRHNEANIYSLASDSVAALLVERSGLILIGTWGAGVNMVNASHTALSVIYHESSPTMSLSSSEVGSLLALPDGEVWFGTYGKGIDVYDTQTGKFVRRIVPGLENGLGDGIITALVRAGNKYVWVGTQNAGIYRYDRVKNVFEHFSRTRNLANSQIRALHLDSQGTLWVSTPSGVQWLKSGENTFNSAYMGATNRQTFSAGILAFAEREEGLWAGGSDGLFVRPAGRQHFIKVSGETHEPGGLLGRRILGLFNDSKNRLWISTTKGLHKLKSWDGNKAVFETTQKNLNAGTKALFGAMLEDKQGRIWGHLAVFDPENSRFTRLGEAYGAKFGTGWLPAGAQTANGLLLFGGSRGVLVVDTEQFSEWQYQAPLAFNTLSIDGKPVDRSPVLTLSPENKSVSMGISALDYSQPQAIRYRYKLIGYDTDFLQASAKHRNITYTNLDPGDYRFIAQGTNRAGQWSPFEAEVTITVLPAWYQTGWFTMLLVAASAVLLYLAYVLRVRQLTQRKLALEQLVNQRTGELEAAYHEADKQRRKAEASDKAKGEFLSNVSHELKTPMNAIMGYLDLTLSDSTLSVVQQRNISIAHRSSQLLLRLLNDLLDYRKIDSGQFTLESTAFDLHQLCRDVVEMQIARARSKGLSLTLHMADDVCNGREGDPFRLQQVLLNLIDNAIKFTPSGSIDITVRTPEDSEEVYFSVKDTGIGIAQEKLSAIMQPFVQADASMSRRFGGTGLGTTIASQLCRLMGGELSVTSELGRGSEFYFHVPLKRCTLQAASSNIKAEPQGSECSILLVDDLIENTMLIKTLLKNRGYHVVTVNNGYAALGEFSQKEFDVVLMDVQMPGMDGFETTQKMRTLEKGKKNAIIIALTASLFEEKISQCGEVGFDAVVEKSADINTLIKTINAYLQGCKNTASRP